MEFKKGEEVFFYRFHKRMSLLFFLLISLSSLAAQSGSAFISLEPVRIGGTISREGHYSEPALMLERGYRLWEKEMNAKGGILGRPVELVLYDDKSRPDLVRELYTRLIRDDKVDLVVSPYGTPLTVAATGVTEEHKLLMLASASAGRETWERGYRYVMGMYALGDRYQIGFLDIMAREGYRTVSILCDESSSFNVDVMEGAVEWAKRLRLEVLYTGRYSGGGESFLRVLEEARQADAQALILAAYSPDGHEMLRLFTRVNYRPRLLSITIAPIHPGFLETAGTIGDKVFAPSQWEPDERIPFPGTESFLRAFNQSYGMMPSYHAGSAYASCQLLAEAAERMGSLDNTGMRDYIASLDTVTIIGRFKVDQEGRQVGHNTILIQWQNGKKEIVWPVKMRTAKPLF